MGNDRAALEGAPLLFCTVPTDALRTVRRGGLAGDTTPFYPTLAAAEQAQQKGQKLLVVVGAAARNAHVPAEAILNLRPYRPPKPVTAGGGVIVRPGTSEPDVLLIYRRGAWDLPKGKLDKGETVEACALRECREELGIRRLALLSPAGTTLHGYPEGKRYMVKTTHWYFMRTPERSFEPEAREGIEEVAWVPWSEALDRLGYESLRRHLHALTPPMHFPS